MFLARSRSLTIALIALALWCGSAIARLDIGDSLIHEALAQVGCVPNPNDTAPPFVNGCPITAKGLNAALGNWASPKVWGAKGDGITDDRAAVQAAIDAGRNVTLGSYMYCIGAPGLVVNKPVSISGATPGWPWDYTQPQYGFRACAANVNILTFNTNAAGSTVDGVFFDGGSWTNTGGSGITVAGASYLRITHVEVMNACIGIDERTSNNDRIEQVMLRGGTVATPLPSGCGGLRVGAASTSGSNQVDLRVVGTTADIHGDYGMLIQDAGGLQIHNVDILDANNGLLIKPGANQSVLWLFADNSALGDTTCQAGLMIDTGAASSTVSGLVFNTTWTASAQAQAAGCLGPGVQIQNTGSGTVRGVHFVGHRSYNNGREGFLLEPAVLDVTIDNSYVCNNSVQTSVVPANNYAGIAVSASVTAVSIRNNKISPDCMFSANTTLQKNGIYLYGSNSNIIITGNNFQDSTTPVGGSPPTGFAVINDNLGMQDQVDAIAAAPTITAGLNPTVSLTGATATITNIAGMWNGREVWFIATANAQNFAAGAGATKVCNTRAVPVGGAVKGIMFNGANCVWMTPP